MITKLAWCKACEAPIVFLTNPDTGAQSPVDVTSVRPTDTAYNKDRHISHFKTCTDPDRFSKGAKRKDSK